MRKKTSVRESARVPSNPAAPAGRANAQNPVESPGKGGPKHCLPVRRGDRRKEQDDGHPADDQAGQPDHVRTACDPRGGDDCQLDNYSRHQRQLGGGSRLVLDDMQNRAPFSAAGQFSPSARSCTICRPVVAEAHWASSTSSPRTSARSLATSCSGVSDLVGGGAPTEAAHAGPSSSSRRQRSSCRSRTLEPVPQRAPLDPQVISDATHRRARSGLVQVDGLPTELLGVVLAGHGSGSSRFPSRCGIQRVQEPGSGPGRH